jgi:hypothetical protein
MLYELILNKNEIVQFVTTLNEHTWTTKADNWNVYGIFRYHIGAIFPVKNGRIGDVALKYCLVMTFFGDFMNSIF